MEKLEAATITGVLRTVGKKRHCIYLTFLDERGREVRFVYEPQIWDRGPKAKVVEGKVVTCTGIRETPFVSMRGRPPPPIRFRATKPIVVSEEQPKSGWEEDDVPWTHKRTSHSARPQQQKFEMTVEQVRSALFNETSKLHWMKKGYWYCFSEESLCRVVSLTALEVTNCVLELIRRGEVALISEEEGLFTTITHESFVGPALLMTIYNFPADRPSTAFGGDEAVTLNEWIDLTKKYFLGRFNLKDDSLAKSARRLVEQSLVIQTPSGRFRRPVSLDREPIM